MLRLRLRGPAGPPRRCRRHGRDVGRRCRRSRGHDTVAVRRVRCVRHVDSSHARPDRLQLRAQQLNGAIGVRFERPRHPRGSRDRISRDIHISISESPARSVKVQAFFDADFDAQITLSGQEHPSGSAGRSQRAEGISSSCVGSCIGRTDHGESSAAAAAARGRGSSFGSGGLGATPLASGGGGSSDAMTPGGGGTAVASSPPALFLVASPQRRQMELALLLRLRHARGCEAAPCAGDRRLEGHARGCRAGEACTVKLCWPSRCIMSHFAQCEDASCPLCGPARRTPAEVCRGGSGSGAVTGVDAK